MSGGRRANLSAVAPTKDWALSPARKGILITVFEVMCTGLSTTFNSTNAK